MYCSVHRPVNTPGVSDNKGSCLQLVEYLSKESNDERPYFYIVIIYITSISIAGFNVMSIITSRKILNKKQSAH